MALHLTAPVHRGMMDLDRDAFKLSVPLIGARVPGAETSTFLKADALKKQVLREPRLRNVVYHEGEDDRIVLFNVCKEDDLAADAREFLKSHGAELVPYTLNLDYDYWTREQILNAILPDNLVADAPSAFTITGHLAHYNLRDEFLPYKHLVGELTLDKNSNLRTVVNKLDSIDTQFRFFKMELLAGDPDYVVEVHEAGCSFTFDFSGVYWNSRLHTEHERLVALFQPGEVVADAFAGVGPFAIPAAKNRRCLVYANDLNPQSVRWLQENVKKNKVDPLVEVTESDGRHFIQRIFKSAWKNPMQEPPPFKTAKQRAKERHDRSAAVLGAAAATSVAASPPVAPSAEPRRDLRRVHHVVMNLPDSALTFLDAFRGVLNIPEVPRSEIEAVYAEMPMVHVHCFTRELVEEAAKADLSAVIQRAQQYLGAPLPNDAVFHLVRSVAPNKEMYCISFRLPNSVAFA
ncbi:guanine-N(1)--methyltransferase [Auriculariales sp. MPI-PUGE-AT-0066]|nr:guanine-N(1)--methyltransferase [Auriculariales sp. MPI-PUGE-AT-0066]